MTTAFGSLLVRDGFRLDLIDDLRDSILARERDQRQSAPTLNRGGWRSADLVSRGDPVVDDLIDAIRSVDPICDVIGRGTDGRARGGMTMWAMINRRGDCHPHHTHQGSSWTGVYYVNPGDGGSPTIFEIPGEGEVVVSPEPGRLAIFPASMWHRVPPSIGDGARITLAFDVRRAA